MAPVNKMRTYSRSNNHTVNNSVDAFNALFAKNMTKRLIGKKKKKKVLIRELPTRAKCDTLLGNDSLQISTEDTFDKLVKGALGKPTTSEDHLSNTNTKNSNITKKRSYIKEKTTYHSPIMTRSRSRSHKSDPFFTRMQEPTVDGVNSADVSIEIEKVKNKNEIKSISYINIPELRVPDTPIQESITESFTGNIFTKTFRERQMIHCSTPVGVVAKKRIINHTLSPITNLTTPGLKSLVEESFKEIKKWDHRVPNLIEVDDTNCNSHVINIEDSCTNSHGFVEERSKNELRKKTSNSSKNKIDDSNRRDSYIILRKRKIPRKNDDSCIEKNLTVSLQDFNTFETRHRSYSLNDFEKFVEQTLDVPGNFVTKRRKRFTDSYLDYERKVHKPENSIYSNCLVMLSKADVTQMKNKESAIESNQKIENESFKEKQLHVNITKLPILCCRTTSLCSTLSHFEAFYKRNINEKINISKSKDVYLSEDLSNENLTQVSKDVNKFESFYMQNYKMSVMKDNISDIPPQQNLIVHLTNNHYESNQDVSKDPVSQNLTNLSYGCCKDSKETNNDTVNSFIPQNLVVQLTKNNFDNVDENNDEFSKDIIPENLELSTKCNIWTNSEHVNDYFRSFLSENLDESSPTNNRSTGNRNTDFALSMMSSSNDCDKSTKGHSTKKVGEGYPNVDLIDENAVNNCENPLMGLDLDNETEFTDNLKINEDTIELENYKNCSNECDITATIDKNFATIAEALYIEPDQDIEFTECNQINDCSILKSARKSIIDLTDDTPDQRSKKNNESFIETPLDEQWQQNLNENYSGQRLLFDTDPDESNKNVLQTDQQVDKLFGDNKDVIILSPKKDTPLLKKSRSSAENIFPENNTRNVLHNSNNEKSLSDIIESSLLDSSKVDSEGFTIPVLGNKRKKLSKTLLLKPGKLWRRSLSILKRSSVMLDLIKETSCSANNGNYCECSNCSLSRNSIRLSNKRMSIRIVPVNPSPVSPNCKISILENYALNNSYVQEADQVELLEGNLEESLRCLSLSKQIRNSILENCPVTAREVVLRRCGQTEPILFQTCYPESTLQNCQKIGEGVYGEVFLFKNPNGGTSVMKVIPIEGDLLVNGERQKKFEEILSEIIIAMELSNLRHNEKNATSCFSEVQKIQCVQGCYPQRLLDLWDLYDETRGSENDCPDIFAEDQLYIVLQLANAGKDLEAYIFNNAIQAFSMFKQVAFAIAVAEEDLRFEHRDLHWGNVLLSTVERNKKVAFCLDNETYELQTKGVEVAIIDFTLSRIEYEGVVIYNDLSLDPELFTAEGDYQFEVYRLMQKKNRNNWQIFEPYSNLLWLHYILDKAISALRYKNVHTKTHKEYINKFKQVKHDILTYKSVKDFVLDCLL